MNWFDENLDPKYVKICIYAGITALATMSLGLLIYNSGGVLSAAWALIGAVARPFVYGMLICYLLLPVVRWFTDWLARRHVFADNFVRRLHISVAITVVLVALLLLSISFLLVLVITRSVQNVSLETVKALISSAEGDIMRLIGNVRRLAVEYGLVSMDSSTSALTGALSEATDIARVIVFSVIFGVYFLLDGARVFNYAKRLFVAVAGGYLGPDLSQVLADADAAFSGYLRGQFLDALTVGIVTALTFTIAGVPYGPVIGLLTGVGNMIPYVGGPVGYVTTIFVCLAEGDTTKLLVGVIALSVIMFLDTNVLQPRLLAHAVKVHPLLVVVSLIAGSALGGLAGMLIAVPTASFVKVQIDRWLARRERELGIKGEGSRHARIGTPYEAGLDREDPMDDLDEPDDLGALEAAGRRPA